MLETRTAVQEIMRAVYQLPMRERVYLIEKIAQSLLLPMPEAGSRPLIRGEFSEGRMSTEEDFRIATCPGYTPRDA